MPVNFIEFISLPLLTKEMIEQAQSKRTYILRAVFAIVLYGLAMWQYSDISGGGAAAGVVNAGRGFAFFQQLFWVQFWAIVILVPAMTCGAVTVEKEKDTLALLLLTKLSPFTIVFEKTLSRVFAMGTYQLLSLPLFAIVYGMGGVELHDVIHAIIALMSMTVILASISIVSSTFFRTTSAAFIAVYLTMPFLSCCVTPFGALLLSPSRAYSQSTSGFSPPPQDALTALIAAVFVSFFAMAFTVIVSGALIYVASILLVPRAFVKSRNFLLEFFKIADIFFHELNQQTTGGIVLVSDRALLPTLHPIAWRETSKRSLGTFRYQFRVLMLLLAPLIIAISSAMSDGQRTFSSPFRAFPIFFWSVSVICLVIHSTGVIPAERIRQTLDVLLVAPLTAAEIVLEKLSGVRRLIKILSVPFVVLIAFQAIWTGYVIQGATFQPSFVLELVSASLATLIYMPVIMWIGFQYGLRLRTQMQAVLATVATIAVICLGPFLASQLLNSFSTDPFLRGTVSDALPWLSPISAINLPVPQPDRYGRTVNGLPVVGGSGPNINQEMAWRLIEGHFALFLVLWWFLRTNALRRFSKIVRRTEETAEPMAE